MEEWRDVPGYEGVYQISISTKEGKCRRISKTGWKEQQGGYSKNGYKSWLLTKNYKSKRHQAARWIALTYPELVQNEYFEGAEIDHIDTDRLNNHPSNLRWVTRLEQMNNPLTKEHRKHHNKSKWVIKLNKNSEILHFYPSLIVASQENKIPVGNICSCCKGKYKSAGGFIWKYAK